MRTGAVQFPVRQFSKLVVSASHPPHLQLVTLFFFRIETQIETDESKNLCLRH
jgi:hypothetical protein